MIDIDEGNSKTVVQVEAFLAWAEVVTCQAPRDYMHFEEQFGGKVPDDCLDARRRALFAGRAVMCDLVDTLRRESK